MRFVGIVAGITVQECAIVSRDDNVFVDIAIYCAVQHFVSMIHRYLENTSIEWQYEPTLETEKSPADAGVYNQHRCR